MNFMVLLNNKQGRILNMDLEQFYTEQFEISQKALEMEQLLAYFQSHKQKFLKFFKDVFEKEGELNGQEGEVLGQIGLFYSQVQERYVSMQQSPGSISQQNFKMILDNYFKVYKFFNLILNQSDYQERQDTREYLDMASLSDRQVKSNHLSLITN